MMIATITPFDALRDPSMLHAIVVHAPIVLSVVGAGFIAAAALHPKSMSVRLSAAVLTLITLTATVTAIQTGKGAHAEVGEVSEAAYAAIDAHESLANVAWIAPAVTTLLIIAAFVLGRTNQRLPWILAGVAGFASAAMIGNVAHHGGILVYSHGVGAGTPAGVATAAPAGTRSARQVFFDTNVLPALKDNCFRCHNPSRQEKSGGLDLTTANGMLAGGENGPVVVPGQPDASSILLRLRDTDDPMPPDDDPLAPEVIADIAAWIADGAVR